MLLEHKPFSSLITKIVYFGNTKLAVAAYEMIFKSLIAPLGPAPILLLSDTTITAEPFIFQIKRVSWNECIIDFGNIVAIKDIKIVTHFCSKLKN